MMVGDRSRVVASAMLSDVQLPGSNWTYKYCNHHDEPAAAISRPFLMTGVLVFVFVFVQAPQFAPPAIG